VEDFILIKLVDINEENWINVKQLCVSDNQRAYLDSPMNVIARGYVYRYCNAKVIGIANDNQIIGIALVRDLDEEPACYDLQQFMIDKRFQNNGFGTEALKLIVSMLQDEGKYNCVEVCVSKSNAAALRVFEKIGFKDTGYIDNDVPDCLNLMYYFRESQKDMPIRSLTNCCIALSGSRNNIPVVYNDDFGHGTKHAVLPIGMNAELDADRQSLFFI